MLVQLRTALTPAILGHHLRRYNVALASRRPCLDGGLPPVARRLVVIGVCAGLA